MESVAAFAVACNVMQVIQTGLKTITLCKTIYKGKSPDPNTAENSTAIGNAAQELQRSLASMSSANLASGEKELAGIANKLVTTADALQKEMKKCEASSGASKLSAVGKALKYHFSRREKINDLNRSLNEMQNAMQSRVLLQLR